MALLLQTAAKNVVIIESATGNIVGELQLSNAVSISFLSDRELLIVSHDKETDIWSFYKTDLRGNSLGTLGDERRNCGLAQFVVMSKRLLNVCGNHQIQITDLETNEIQRLIGHQKDKRPDFQFTEIVSSPKVDLAVSLSTWGDYSSRQTMSEIRIWDADSGLLIREIETAYKIKDLRFSPDGCFLAYLSEDGTIHILGIESDVKAE